MPFFLEGADTGTLKDSKSIVQC